METAPLAPFPISHPAEDMDLLRIWKLSITLLTKIFAYGYQAHALAHVCMHVLVISQCGGLYVTYTQGSEIIKRPMLSITCTIVMYYVCVCVCVCVSVHVRVH